VHATDLELRRELLANPEAPDVMGQLRRLAGYGIEVHTQLVIVPGMNDGAVLERSVEDLAALWPAVRTVSVVPVGLTRFHRQGLRTNTPAEAEAALAQVEGLQARHMRAIGDRFVYATDEWYLLAGRSLPPVEAYPQLEALVENGVGLVGAFMADWEKQRRMLGRRKLETTVTDGVTLATGALFAPLLSAAAAELGRRLGIDVRVQAIRNVTLGETVTVSGLLMGGDVVRQLREAGPGEVVALPAVMFRGPGGMTLDGLTRREISAALGSPVVLVETMSDLLKALTEGSDGE
jgi:putative radical SAM enzyme (TIGR03279 family)